MPSRLRPALVACVAVVLLLVGSTTAYAAWSRATTAAAGSVAGGTFAGTVTWSTPLNLAGMYPGETRVGVVQVARTAGTNGRWVYTVGTPTVAVSGAATTASTALATRLTVTPYTAGTFSGTTCGGTPLTLGAASAVQALGSVVQHCVAVQLAANAPGTVQGGAVVVTVPVTLENRSTN
ncbi:hypothetical protein [Cellulomonas xylanilytica]|uniref:Ribosomally synthesized peptide with SipW-like signal peptide n=1 Tax=Cellulomonas xylanilytica TaxID=233583 RepID=A0A510V5D7_9CELL|nr:hypothetical protein [Cellulomonas xylanilytica]GEK22074.1 hypothetical protein CXY01_25940 [Cellulomonas xylanilytica]